MGAALAVIFAHAAPFMGAQTTIMQRYFLPHPLDTIISQPFGMSEDLISMGMAEASSNPVLASVSLTVLIVGFNLAQFVLFSRIRDWKAFATANLNFIVGLFIYSMIVQSQAKTGFEIVQDASGKVEWIRAAGPAGSSTGLSSVAAQLALQVLGVPILSLMLPSQTPCGREEPKLLVEV